MTDVIVAAELWSTSLLPEGIFERWRIVDGAVVSAGQVVAEVRIGDSLHELMAPTDGRLSIAARKNDLVEPGSVIGHLAPVP
jgi:hypothetical protein